jgi:hypothetical protein
MMGGVRREERASAFGKSCTRDYMTDFREKLCDGASAVL